MELLAETITLSDKTVSNKIFVTFARQNILSGEKFCPFSEFEISSKKDSIFLFFRDPQFFYHKNTVTKKNNLGSLESLICLNICQTTKKYLLIAMIAQGYQKP